MEAYDSMVEIHLQQGLFQEALSLNQNLREWGIKTRSLRDQLKAEQWEALVYLENGHLDKAAIHVEKMNLLAAEIGSKAYVNGGNIMCLHLLLKRNNLFGVREPSKFWIKCQTMFWHKMSLLLLKQGT